MQISEERLRRLIRKALYEQVVGYTPPSKKDDSGDDDFMSYGDISEPAPQHASETSDPEEEEQLQTQSQQLTQQRQQDVNKGDAVGANYAGRQLQKLKKSTG